MHVHTLLRLHIYKKFDLSIITIDGGLVSMMFVCLHFCLLLITSSFYVPYIFITTTSKKDQKPSFIWPILIFIIDIDLNWQREYSNIALTHELKVYNVSADAH